MLPRLLLFLALAACGPDEPTDTTDSDVTDTEVISDASNRDGVCSFNYDCPADQRCECSEADGCACADGERGTGQNGIDTCETGEDCVSALCVEGLDASYCSDTCETEADCEEALPVCMNVAFVGRICVRDAS